MEEDSALLALLAPPFEGSIRDESSVGPGAFLLDEPMGPSGRTAAQGDASQAAELGLRITAAEPRRQAETLCALA